MTIRTSCRALVTALRLRPTVFRMPGVDCISWRNECQEPFTVCIQAYMLCRS